MNKFTVLLLSVAVLLLVTEAHAQSGAVSHPANEQYPDFPEFAQTALLKLDDSIHASTDRVYHADFNNDGFQDFATYVASLRNGSGGILLIEQGGNQRYFLFGAGNESAGQTDLSWADEITLLPKGKLIVPALLDPHTGDILGEDESKAFQLIGDALMLRAAEQDGRLILFWDGKAYTLLSLD